MVTLVITRTCIISELAYTAVQIVNISELLLHLMIVVLLVQLMTLSGWLGVLGLGSQTHGHGINSKP